MTLRGAARQVEAERAARRTAAGVECWAPLPACPGCGHVVRRDDWAVRTPRGSMWHADCWHDDRGDLLDLTALDARRGGAA